MFVAYLLARNIRYEEDVVDQLFNSSEKRLARLLLMLAHFGKEGVPEPVVPKISQETLAEMVGTTRSRVSFFMNRFRKVGFFSMRPTRPSALLLGLTAAICSLIPILGTALVWVPAAIYLMATGHVVKGIVLTLFGALVVGMVDNIIRPLVIGSRVELHPLLLLFAVLGGLQAFGFIGIFVGPVVISLIAALTTMVREELHAL
jgi:AI-2E family transporter/Crp-like helix-turn-helix domain